MPRITPAANTISPSMMMPMAIKDTGTIFSKKKESFGICDLLFVLIGFAMINLVNFGLVILSQNYPDVQDEFVQY